MAEPRLLGEIAIDRLFTGYKVCARLFHPWTGKPQLVGSDHFPTYERARSFAEQLSAASGHEIVDNTKAPRK
jgi:hypothetical protein